MNKLFTKKVQSMQVYNIPDSSGLIKLDAMEMPYLLPKEKMVELADKLTNLEINRYPNPEPNELIDKIKKTLNLSNNQTSNLDIILGNGSDELISIILLALSKPKAVVLSPTPSFVMYQQTSELLGMKFVGVDLNDDFSINLENFLVAIKTQNPALIFLSYPNNPTGNSWNKVELEQILQATNGFVVLDEAYNAFADDSALDLVEKYENAILLRTFSKVGLAGVRLGFMACHKKYAQQFNKARPPYNTNILSQEVVDFTLNNMELIEKNVELIKLEKESLLEFLSKIPNTKTIDTQTNFLLFKVENSEETFKKLRDEFKILVKDLNVHHKLLENTLRITIGAKEENKILKQALNKIFSLT